MKILHTPFPSFFHSRGLDFEPVHSFKLTKFRELESRRDRRNVDIEEYKQLQST